MKRVNKIMRATVATAILISLSACLAFTAGQPPKQLSKETQLKLLKLEEARVSLQTAQDLFEDYQRDLKDLQELYRQDVVTGKEVSDAETDMKDASRKLELAKIDLAKTALSFLQESTHISITEAYQYIDSTNNRHMSITLINDSDLELALLGLGQGVPEAGIKKENVPGLLTIENLYVAIKSGATVVGDPFEIKVAKLPLSDSVTLDFRLNSATDDVTVSLKYHNQEESRNIFLSKKSSEDIVRVTSLQFAQEGQLGGSIEYGFDLERLAENEATFNLAVVNLPEKYIYKFADKGNQLSRVKFSQGVTKHSLSLKVNVPDTLPMSELRKSIPFFIIVGDENAMKVIDKYTASGGKVTQEQLETLKVGFDKLELTPRGVGKFEISFETLFYEIKVGDAITAKMTVKNTGSVTLSNIRFNTEKPPDWNITFEPEDISKLAPRKEQEVTVKLVPPSNVEVGAYEMKVEGETEYEGSSVTSDQKNVRVEVAAKTKLSSGLMLVGGLCLVMLVLLVVTVKVSRR